MGATNFFVWADADGVDHIVSADLVQSGTDERQTKLTQHAVEDGAQVSDHVIRMPDRASFDLIQTQTPFFNLPFEGLAFKQRTVEVEATKPPAKKGLLSIAIPPSTQAVDTGNPQAFTYKFHAFSVDTPRDRIRDLHQKLEELLDNAHEVAITFRGYTMTQMILTGLRSQSNPGELGIGRFSLQFTKLNTVTTQQGANLPNPNAGRLQAEKKRAAKAAQKQSEEQGRTLLSRLSGNLFADAGLN